MGVIDEVDTVGLKVTVLKAAVELDVFTTIVRGYHSLEVIAAVLQCSVRGMGVLLDALCPLGLLHKSGGTYALTPTSAPYAEFHTFSEYKELLESAGFTHVTLHGARPVSAIKQG